MAITPKSIKLLWSAAAGRCSFPDCWERLTYPEAEGAAPYTLGEMAHICGDNPGSNRHDPSQSPTERDDYRNLMLLCPTHHTLIDRKENEAAYPVDLLHKFKADHEKKVLERIDKNQSLSKVNICKQILFLIDDNRTSWEQYGPLSDLARKQPENGAAHAVWISERLSVIIPNNRKIVDLLKEHRDLFALEEQPSVSKFLTHSRSYERWVNDEIPYAAVIGFPTEFAELIRGAAK